MTITKKQLRTCQAHVIISENDRPIDLQWFDCIGTRFNAILHNYITLISYKSAVAVYDLDSEVLYLLPRWNHSNTTRQHLRKFIKDYVSWLLYRFNVRDAKREAIAGVQLVDGYVINGHVYRF